MAQSMHIKSFIKSLRPLGILATFCILTIAEYRIRRPLAMQANSLLAKQGRSETTGFSPIWLCLIPWPSLGDAYNAARCLDSWAAGRPYVVVVTSQRNLELLNLCGIVSVRVRNDRDMRLLVRLSYFLGEGITYMKVLHYGPKYAQESVNRFLLGYKNLSFFDITEATVFSRACKRRLPFPADFIDKSLQSKQLASSRGRSKKLKILLCPDSVTLSATPQSLWIDLGRLCLSDGCEVSVNTEDPVLCPKGGVRLFPPLSDIGNVACSHDCVITARSGLADVLAALPIPLVVLYPSSDKHDWGVASPRVAWTLAGELDRENLVEIEVPSGEAGGEEFQQSIPPAVPSTNEKQAEVDKALLQGILTTAKSLVGSLRNWGTDL